MSVLMRMTDALAALEEGKRIARDGWIMPGKYIVRMPGYPEGIKINAATAAATGLEEGSVQRFAPYFLFKDGSGVFRPWNPSSADLIAEDWKVVEYS